MHCRLVLTLIDGSGPASASALIVCTASVVVDRRHVISLDINVGTRYVLRRNSLAIYNYSIIIESIELIIIVRSPSCITQPRLAPVWFM